MTPAICRFQREPAGFVATDVLQPGTASYGFIPVRSVAHLRLVEAVNAHGRAVVEIEINGETVQRLATRVLSDTITLADV